MSKLILTLTLAFLLSPRIVLANNEILDLSQSIRDRSLVIEPLWPKTDALDNQT